MKLLQGALIILFTAVVVSPIVTATPASAWKKKCYHCYYTAYGKKICHNDCKCYKRH